MKSARRQNSAFTLVEILIVLAIIGILAAILLPAFNSARESARTTTCSSNLRQISLGLQLYLDSNNRRYPPPVPLLSKQHRNWAVLVLPYTRSEQTFNCPSNPNENTNFDADYPPSSNVIEAGKFNGSYGLNILQVSGIQGTPESRVRRPSNTILVTELNPTPTESIWPGPNVIGVPRPYNTPEDLGTFAIPVPGWHREGANVLFVDGHVKWMSLEAMCDEQLWMPDK